MDISLDTQAIILLTNELGNVNVFGLKPLTNGEYNLIANWLRENKFRPGDLLKETVRSSFDSSVSMFMPGRINDLLKRRAELKDAMHRWNHLGVWAIGRGDAEYPQILKRRLKYKSPAVLYGSGDKSFAGGVAIVGSRKAKREALDYTRQLGRFYAQKGFRVISGGAEGVDKAAISGALAGGGKVTGVLATSLVNEALNQLDAVNKGQLTLISHVDPDAGFSVQQRAMERNRLIYALSDQAMVIASDLKKGGTWTGAHGAMKDLPELPLYVRSHPDAPEGNQELIKLGAKPFK